MHLPQLVPAAGSHAPRAEAVCAGLTGENQAPPAYPPVPQAHRRSAWEAQPPQQRNQPQCGQALR